MLMTMPNMEANCNTNTMTNTSNDDFTNKEVIMEISGDAEKTNDNKTGKQSRPISSLSPFKETYTPRNHDKALGRVKTRKNRELGELEKNQILNARLRSNSGRVHSSSAFVDVNPVRLEETQLHLDTVFEEEGEQAESTYKMCGNNDCCKGTNTLIEMVSKLQKSVDGVLKKVSTQEIVTSNNSHRVIDLQDKCDSFTDEIDDLGKEFHETKFQLDMVTKIVIKQDQQISFLKQRIIEIQQREMSANVVISGIPEKRMKNQ